MVYLCQSCERDITNLQDEPCDTAEEALNRFVMVMEKEYDSEDDFMNNLFRTLRSALGNLCVPFEKSSSTCVNRRTRAMTRKRDEAKENHDDGNQIITDWIILKDCNVGFTTKVDRCDNLQLCKEIDILKNSKTNIMSVVVKRNDDVIDITSVVEIKLSNTRCKDFDNRSKHSKPPDLADDHAPLVQALYYTHDTFFCLSRRGIKTEESHLPVVV
jgi:hypothetical protein